MRSKWLDWKASASEIIEKIPEHEPTKPTQPSSVSFVSMSSGDFPITRDANMEQVTSEEEKQAPTLPVPTGAILVALRYDGVGKPLASIPKCWCCKTQWALDQLQDWKGQTYAFLKPGCGCLDAPQALACCGLCIEHCQCRNRKLRTGDRNAQKPLQKDFRTPQGNGDSL